MRRIAGPLLMATAAHACTAATDSTPAATTERVFDLDVDTPITGTEDYVCLPLEIATSALGDPVVAIRWDAPIGAVTLHHATLYATTTTTTPTRGAACEAISDARAIARTVDVWTPGSELAFDDGAALALPAGTNGLVVQAHVLRTRDGDAGLARLHLTTTRMLPSQLHAWTGFGAPVPALRPHMADASRTSCVVKRAVHVVVAWPHMHRIGTSIGIDVVHAGANEALLEISPWSFDRQPIHAISRDLAAGDTVTLRCAWNNIGDAYVLPGPLTTNEMCTAGIVAWPAPADWLECP